MAEIDKHRTGIERAPSAYQSRFDLAPKLRNRIGLNLLDVGRILTIEKPKDANQSLKGLIAPADKNTPTRFEPMQDSLAITANR